MYGGGINSDIVRTEINVIEMNRNLDDFNNTPRGEGSTNDLFNN